MKKIKKLKHEEAVITQANSIATLNKINEIIDAINKLIKKA
jgi:hypothetical protein